MADAASHSLDPAQQQLIEASRARSGGAPTDHLAWSRWTNAVAFVVVAIVFAALVPTHRDAPTAELLGLVAAYALAARIQFEVGSGLAIPTELAFVPMLFVLPARLVPLAVAAGYVLSQLPEAVGGRARAQSLAVALGSGWFALAPAAVLAALGEPDATSGRWWLLVPLLAAQIAADFSSTALREGIALGVRPRELVEPMKWVASVDGALAPIGFATAVAARVDVACLLMPLPLLGLIHLFARQREAAIDSGLELSNAYRGTAILLGDVIEADDHYTASHSAGVLSLSLDVGRRMGLAPAQLRELELVAMLHDVGKIRIPNELIRKPGPLTPDEWAIVKTHTIEGEKLLMKVGGLLGLVGRLVRSCHERWDGTGYPDRLAGEEIPLVARIVSCCDAFDAMTTDRSYRKALTAPQAVAELRACAGTQFDPAVVGVLVSILQA